MNPWMAQLIAVVEVAAIVCITYLVAQAMKLRHERRMFEAEGGKQELERQLEEFRALTEAQFAELQERLEFSERLLAEGRHPRIEESETPTPV